MKNTKLIHSINTLITKPSFVGRIVYRWAVLLLCSLVLSACGFALRGSQALPEDLSHVKINSQLQYTGISQALEERLPVYQLNIISSEQETEKSIDLSNIVTINLQPENFERRLLSVFSTGQVAEYELVYSLSYQVVFPGMLPIQNQLFVSREYQDDPDQILAKSRELDLVLEELRTESADRIIRLLSNQLNSAKLDPNYLPPANKNQSLPR